MKLEKTDNHKKRYLSRYYQRKLIKKSKSRDQELKINYKTFFNNIFSEKQKYKNKNLISKMESEIEKIDDRIYNLNKKNIITQKTNQISPSSKKSKKNEKKILKNKDKKKTTTILSSFFNKDSEEILKIILFQFLLAEDKNLKDIKKKFQEYKKIEKSILHQNEFLMFLLNKKVSYRKQKSLNFQEISYKFNFIKNKLTSFAYKEDISKLLNDNKIINIDKFLNQKLFSKYFKLEQIVSKHNIEHKNPIFSFESKTIRDIINQKLN